MISLCLIVSILSGILCLVTCLVNLSIVLCLIIHSLIGCICLCLIQSGVCIITYRLICLRARWVLRTIHWLVLSIICRDIICSLIWRIICEIRCCFIRAICLVLGIITLTTVIWSIVRSSITLWLWLISLFSLIICNIISLILVGSIRRRIHLRRIPSRIRCGLIYCLSLIDCIVSLIRRICALRSVCDVRWIIA